MKKIAILLGFLFLITGLSFSQGIPHPLLNRVYDNITILDFDLGSGANTQSDTIYIPTDMTWTMEVQVTGLDKFTGYLKAYWGSNTGVFSLMPVDSIPLTVAAKTYTWNGDFNNLDYWFVQYTGATSTTGHIRVRLTGSLKYRY